MGCARTPAAAHVLYEQEQCEPRSRGLSHKVIGPVLREEIAKLKAEGKEALFAGVLVGLEPSIDDYSKPNPERTKMMKEDGVPAGPLGYRALLDRGFSADHPPDDFRKALAKIVQETIAFWCEQFVDAGIPAEKLYPHVAAPAPIEMMNAPIWTAFNKYSRPGWTTYAVGVLGESFKPSMTSWRSMAIPPGRAWRQTQASRIRRGLGNLPRLALQPWLRSRGREYRRHRLRISPSAFGTAPSVRKPSRPIASS
jgi:hypothetical protein